MTFYLDVIVLQFDDKGAWSWGNKATRGWMRGVSHAFHLRGRVTGKNLLCVYRSVFEFNM